MKNHHPIEITSRILRFTVGRKIEEVRDFSRITYEQHSQINCHQTDA